MTDDPRRDPKLEDVLHRYVAPGDGPNDWEAISAGAARRRPLRRWGSVVAVAACAALTLLTVALIRGQRESSTASVPSPTQVSVVDGGTPLIDVSRRVSSVGIGEELREVLVTSTIDGVRLQVGRRPGSDALCFVVTLPTHSAIGRCGFTPYLLTHGGAYVVPASDADGRRMVYGLAPDGVVRIVSGRTVVPVVDRAFVITVASDVNRLIAETAEGAISEFPILRPVRSSPGSRIASSTAVVRADGSVSFPPSIVAAVAQVNAAFGRCMRANGTQSRLLSDGSTRIVGDDSHCAKERSALGRLTASPTMKAANRSREAAAWEIARCVGEEMRIPLTMARERLHASTVDADVRDGCVPSVRDEAINGAYP